MVHEVVGTGLLVVGGRVGAGWIMVGGGVDAGWLMVGAAWIMVTGGVEVGFVVVGGAVGAGLLVGGAVGAGLPVVTGVRVVDGPAPIEIEGLACVVLVDFELPQAASAKATPTVISRRARPVPFMCFTLPSFGSPHPPCPP
jgi:hypothetical protein